MRLRTIALTTLLVAFLEIENCANLFAETLYPTCKSIGKIIDGLGPDDFVLIGHLTKINFTRCDNVHEYLSDDTNSSFVRTIYVTALITNTINRMKSVSDVSFAVKLSLEKYVVDCAPNARDLYSAKPVTTPISTDILYAFIARKANQVTASEHTRNDKGVRDVKYLLSPCEYYKLEELPDDIKRLL